MKTDDLGCNHWGVMNMLTSGRIRPTTMKWYLAEGRYLFNNRCGGCGRFAKDLTAKDKDLVDRASCFVCNGGVVGHVTCSFFLCRPCLLK